ncbi:MAG: sulfatase [Planctomycetota bacterium]
MKHAAGRLGRSVALGSCLFAGPAFGGAALPNIVFMLADDQAWSGLSVPMHPTLPGSFTAAHHTPHAARLAAQGTRFSQAYAPAPVCAPTRAALVTGRSPASLGWTRAGPSLRAADNPPLLPGANARQLDGEYVTFAERLIDAGYATAHFGKWHLSGGGPEAHGFAVSDGDLGNEAAAKFTDPNPVDLFGMASRAEDFMEAARDDGRPFYAQLSWHALHAPQNARTATLARYETAGLRGRAAARAALTEDLDEALGRVLDAVDRLGLAGNTYVVYTSDNGGTAPRRRNTDAALRGGKGTLYEGGLRVPLIVRGPGVAADAWCDVPTVGTDWYPTFLDWAGLRPDRHTADALVGGSLAPLLADRASSVDRPRDALLFHFPHYQTDDGPHSAVVHGRHKLIRFDVADRVELYDLSADPGEREDLAAEEPRLARRLTRLLDAELDDLDAHRVAPNPDYDADEPVNLRRPRGTSRR